MKTPEHTYFEMLKEQVVRKMQLSHPEVPGLLSDWKGQDILAFQVELQETLKENISEKWFYTHMKSNHKKLPRIDTLNLLSRFVGYKSWNDFKYNHERLSDNEIKLKDSSNKLFIIIPGIVVAVTLLFYLAVSTIYNQEYSFCFIDRDTGETLEDRKINVSVLIEGESPIYYSCDESGCFSIKHVNRTLSFVVEAPGYHPDTIVRRLNKFNRDEIVKLRPDNNIDQ